MDAVNLGFQDDTFDCPFCVQNGISAFGVDKKNLIGEAVRVTKPGGTVLFSSYSDAFWEQRLRWFKIQSQEGLLGEIVHRQTTRGVIVCRDGFRASTVTAAEFKALTSHLDAEVDITEVDQSSVFCVVSRGGDTPIECACAALDTFHVSHLM